jgi:hypothetical protein
LEEGGVMSWSKIRGSTGQGGPTGQTGPTPGVGPTFSDEVSARALAMRAAFDGGDIETLQTLRIEIGLEPLSEDELSHVRWLAGKSKVQ